MVNDNVIYPKSQHTYDEQRNLSLGYPRQDFSRLVTNPEQFGIGFVLPFTRTYALCMNPKEIRPCLVASPGDFESVIYT